MMNLLKSTQPSTRDEKNSPRCRGSDSFSSSFHPCLFDFDAEPSKGRTYGLEPETVSLSFRPRQLADGGLGLRF